MARVRDLRLGAAGQHRHPPCHTRLEHWPHQPSMERLLQQPRDQWHLRAKWPFVLGRGRSGTNNLVNDHQNGLQLTGNASSRLQAAHYVPAMDTDHPIQSFQRKSGCFLCCEQCHAQSRGGWGTGTTKGTFSGYSQSCQFTITAGSATFTASPTVTFTFPNPAFPVIPVCTLDVHNITGSGGAILFDNSTPSATAPVFTAETATGAAFTPAAGETYTVVLRCGL